MDGPQVQVVCLDVPEVALTCLRLFFRWSHEPGVTAAGAEGAARFMMAVSEPSNATNRGELRVGRVGKRAAAGDAGGGVAC